MKIVRDLGTLTFQFQNTPPPPKMKIVRDLGTLTFQFQNTPPPNENCQRYWHFNFSVSEYLPPQIEIKADLGTLRLFSFRTMCGKLPHVETLSSPDNYSFLQVKYIMQSTKCFETHMVCASSCLNIWRALLVSTDKWRQLVGFYKIPVRICSDDLEFLMETFVLILVKFEKWEKEAGFWFLWCSSKTERHHMDNITRIPKLVLN